MECYVDKANKIKAPGFVMKLLQFVGFTRKLFISRFLFDDICFFSEN